MTSQTSTSGTLTAFTNRPHASLEARFTIAMGVALTLLVGFAFGTLAPRMATTAQASVCTPATADRC